MCYNNNSERGEALKKGSEEMKKMTRLELLAVLLSLKTLLEESKPEKALEVVDELIKEAKSGK